MIHQLFGITIVIITILIAALFCEFFLRFLKNKLKNKDFENIKRIPGIKLARSYEINAFGCEKQNSQKCEVLGWDMIKNSELEVKIKIPYFESQYSCRYIINNLGARSNYKKFSSNEKLFGTFGCSISYGYALDEENTYTNLIHKELKKYDYLNFSVPGYSLYQSLIKYKLVSKDMKFDFIILGIHQDLEKRNTCSIGWADIINNYWKIPRTYKIGRFFNFFPTKKSNLEIINILKFFIGNIKFIQKITMKGLLEEFRKECQKNNTELYIICFDKYNSIYDFLSKKKFNWNSAHLNLEQKNSRNECVFQLMPWDNHPNKEANIIFAKKAMELIKHTKNNTDIFKPTIPDSGVKENPQKFTYTFW
jgi:hypothetical protein